MSNSITIEEYVKNISKDNLVTELKDILEIDPNADEVLLCNKCGDSYASQFCEKNNLNACSFDEIKSNLQKRMKKENELKSSDIECYLKNKFFIKSFIIFITKYLPTLIFFLALIAYSYIFIFNKNLIDMLKSGGWYVLFILLVVSIKRNFDIKNACLTELKNEKDMDIKNLKDIKKQFRFDKVLWKVIKKYFV